MNKSHSFISPVRKTPGTRRLPLLSATARRILLGMLQRLHTGALTVVDGQDRWHFGPGGDPSVTLTVRHPDFYADAVYGGSIGVAESYMLGHWEADDLIALIRLMVRNREVIDGIDEHGLARLATPLRKAAHWLNRNSRSGSRRNIAAHYDLGNDFFATFLDSSWMYSCAIFEQPSMTLAEAQTAKLDRICRKLRLSAQDRVLEIGTGWGGFALHAARHYGCHVTTTTISRQQHELAAERIRQAGLQDRITLLFDDYRDLEGQYDKLVSIEMIEAVGHQYYDTYFECCARLLKPDGQFLLQAITIADQRYEAAARNVDFIQRYIFPGSTIPSVSALLASATRASDLRVFHLEDIGPHYATTLRCWRDRFMSSLDRIRELGCDEQFIRMWEFYFCYCAGGFAERALGDVQMLLVKPGARPAPLLGTIDD
ncbi:MAG: cyclopropane-fatty-acyl-phospholipid synthase family protein [Wenzhouxiangellaceae bacterium]